MEQEVARLQGQLRRAGMPAGEAAEETFIERSRLRFQQARITPTDEDNAKIAEAAKRVRELTEATNALKRSMDIIQSFAQTFSSSLERAFTSWIDGAWKGWRDFFHNLSTQLATLALRTAILQPLFGGGGIQQGGIFGQFLASLIPRAGGGDVQSGQPYMVGERGRELFIPSQSGTIVPNHALGRGGGATINMRIDLAGANGDAAIMRMVQIGAAAAAKQAVMATQAGMPGWQRSARMLGA
jgi:phage-related minor tail protein